MNQSIFQQVKNLVHNQPPLDYKKYVEKIMEVYSHLKEKIYDELYLQLIIYFPEGYLNKDMRIPEEREKYYSDYYKTNNSIKWAIIFRKKYFENPVAIYDPSRHKEISNDPYGPIEKFFVWYDVKPPEAVYALTTLQNLINRIENKYSPLQDWKRFGVVHIHDKDSFNKAIEWMNNRALEEPLTHLKIIADGKYGEKLVDELQVKLIVGTCEYNVLDDSKPIIEVTITNPNMINAEVMNDIQKILLK